MSEQHRYPIIAVEDDPETLRLLLRHLHAAGYAADGFEHGRAAIQPICAMGTGIVLADWAMPEMDGMELCEQLRELKRLEALGNIYFILLSAHHSKEHVIQGLEGGANDYLTKPYHQGELLARLRVGERMLRLQEEVFRRSIEVHKANAQMLLLANQLEQLANTDVLTKLPNRRRLFERLHDTWELSRREDQPLSCIMLDVDHFKHVNDTYGHEAGDLVLVHVANLLRPAVRRPDLCGRFGGEEFVVVCPTMTAEQAVAVAERIRADIEAKPARTGDTTIPVTVSCGVASRDHHTFSVDELLKNADAMLYAAKEHGRNQVWLHTTAGPRGPEASSKCLGKGASGSTTASSSGRVRDRRSGEAIAVEYRDANSDHER